MKDNKNEINEINNDNEIDKIFDEIKSEEIKKQIKKSKKKFLVRNVFISTLAAIVISIGGYIGLQIASWNYCQNKALNNLGYFQDHYNISSPNKFQGGSRRDILGLFESSVECKIYKNIDGHIIYAGTDKKVSGLFGDSNAKDNRGIICQYSDINEISKDIKHRRSSEFGLKYMAFFYPYVNYNKIINDMNILEDINKDKVVEMALSFDKQYSLDEIKKSIPQKLTTFYWIDTEDDFSRKNIIANKTIKDEDNVYGIKLIGIEGKRIEKPEEWFNIFIRDMKGKDNECFPIDNDTRRYLFQNREKMNIKKLKINGVVVVGNRDDILKLKEIPIIKHAMIGTVVDKY